MAAAPTPPRCTRVRSQWLAQLPLLIFVSAGGGLLGSTFNLLKRRVVFWQSTRSGVGWRLLEAALVMLATAGALTLVPALFGTCLDVSVACCAQLGQLCLPTRLPAPMRTPCLPRCVQLPEAWDASDVVQHGCQAGQYNDLATGMQGSAVWVIRSLLSLGSEAEPLSPASRACSLATPCYYTCASLAVLVAAYLALFLLASALIMPGGLFM